MRLDFDVINSLMQDLLVLKHSNLKEIVESLSNGKYRMRQKALPSSGGVYVFWWTGELDDLFSNDTNRKMSFKGPNQREVEVELTEKWINGILNQGKVLLYVGKNVDNLQSRIGQHLQLGTERGLSLGELALGEKRMTTSNQLRDRLERMFLQEKDTRNLILNNVGLSYCILDGVEECANRFYLEGKTIGVLYPLFNLDIER